ncbi:MAG: hypothetical protein DMF74_12360 [Acidobacteria bacterium]|nr:MAG: hypothetical protein DMF74_12360 [Acidobacteriota bacterium]
MAAHAETVSTQRQSKSRERLFYIGMVVAIVITVFAGFSRTFFLRPYFQTQPLIPLLILHGVVFSSWIVLLVTQTTLVATKRTRTHMRLGIAGGLLATLMIVIGTVTAIVRAKGPSPVPGVNPLSFLTIPLGDMLVFATLVGMAFYFRRRADMHKRLMLLATIAILPAAVARLPFAFIQQYGPLAFFGLSDLFIVPCLIYDIVTRRRPHRATVLGGALIVISHPLRLVIGNTHAWLAFATWLTHWT